MPLSSTTTNKTTQSKRKYIPGVNIGLLARRINIECVLCSELVAAENIHQNSSKVTFEKAKQKQTSNYKDNIKI